MKKLICLLTIALFGLPIALSAQKNLQQFMRNCENAKDVEVTVITHKDPETKKEQKHTVRVVFNKMPELEKELIKAYNADKSEAYQSAEKKVNGTIKPEYCRFKDKKQYVRFLFQFTNAERVTVTMDVYDSDPSLTGMINHRMPGADKLEYAMANLDIKMANLDMQMAKIEFPDMPKIKGVSVFKKSADKKQAVESDSTQAESAQN